MDQSAVALLREAIYRALQTIQFSIWTQELFSAESSLCYYSGDEYCLFQTEREEHGGIIVPRFIHRPCAHRYADEGVTTAGHYL